jgi:hypothetical protein
LIFLDDTGMAFYIRNWLGLSPTANSCLVRGVIIGEVRKLE